MCCRKMVDGVGVVLLELRGLGVGDLLLQGGDT